MNYKAKLHKLIDGAYYVGIVENAYDVISNPKRYSSLDIHWIKLGGHKNTWFADPFILKADEKTITMLVEEFEYSTGKGILSELLIDRQNYTLLNVRTILRQDTHLSFPYFINDRGKVYIVPESGQKNEAALYAFDDEGMLQRQKLLIEGQLLDTQICKIGDKWYAFAVKSTEEGLDATKRLFVYEADSLLGEYKEIQCIVNSKNEERGAGLIIEHDGHLLRPAQVCEGGYGKGVILYEMKLENGQFIETEYARFMANPKQKNGLCLHTFSVYGNLIAVDGSDYLLRCFEKINPFIYRMKSIYNKIARRR